MEQQVSRETQRDISGVADRFVEARVGPILRKRLGIETIAKDFKEFWKSPKLKPEHREIFCNVLARKAEDTAFEIDEFGSGPANRREVRNLACALRIIQAMAPITGNQELIRKVNEQVAWLTSRANDKSTLTAEARRLMGVRSKVIALA